MNVGKKSIQSEVLGAVDDRKSAVLRVAIAALTLAIAYETRHLGAASAALFMANVAYSAVIYGLAHGREDFSKTATLLSVAADISIYSLMVLAGFGSPAMFVIFFSFPVLVAGARLGALYGLGSAAASAGLFMTVLYRVTPAESFSWHDDGLAGDGRCSTSVYPDLRNFCANKIGSGCDVFHFKHPGRAVIAFGRVREKRIALSRWR